jgi:hypothetical protein
MNSEEQPKEQYQQGEVIEQRNFTFVIRLDDGRVLPHCFIGRDMKAVFPKVGQRVWVLESPYDPGQARIITSNKKYPYINNKESI